MVTCEMSDSMHSFGDDSLDMMMNPPLNTSTPRNSETNLSLLLQSIRPFPKIDRPKTSGTRRGPKPGKPEMVQIEAAEAKKKDRLSKIKRGRVEKPAKKTPQKKLQTKSKKDAQTEKVDTASTRPGRIGARRKTVAAPKTYYESSSSDMEFDE